jgi:tetratricopeptide (TPR) repeat protein
MRPGTLEAYRAYVHGRFAESERGYRTLVGTYPDEVEAWFQLGETLFHLGPVHGRPMVESREAFRRALLLDPEHGESLVHLAAVALVGRDRAECAALFRRLHRLGELPAPARAMDAFLHGDREAQDVALAELATAGDVPVAIAARYVAASGPNLRGAEAVTRLLVDPQRGHEPRALGHLMLAHWALAAGRWRSARAELARLAALEPGWARTYRALFLVAPLVSPSDAELDAARRELHEPAAPGAHGGRAARNLMFTIHDADQDAIRDYLVGVLSARLSDATGARRAAVALEGRAAGAGGGLAAGFAATLRAHVALQAGHAERALDELAAAAVDMPWEWIYFSPVHGQAHQRFLRAELLARLGRWEEAIHWYRCLDDFMALHLPYAVPAYLRCGVALQRLGEPERAREYLLRFAALWQDCDPEARPRLSRARAEAAAC